MTGNKFLFIFAVFFLISWTFPVNKNNTSEASIASGTGLDTLFENHLQSLYDSCALKEHGLKYEIFKKGMVGYYNMKKKRILSFKSIISLIDFTKPSKEERLWVIDLSKKQVLFHSLVAHGKNSGNDEAIRFSNLEGSNMSSLGFFLTKNTYCGKHGLSLVIEGLDKEFNNNAESRSIVIHGAEYVSQDFIKCNGRLGRSQGCPALPMETHQEIIYAIEGATPLYIHYPHKGFHSTYLDEKEAADEFIKNKF